MRLSQFSYNNACSKDFPQSLTVKKAAFSEKNPSTKTKQRGRAPEDPNDVCVGTIPLAGTGYADYQPQGNHPPLSGVVQ